MQQLRKLTKLPLAAKIARAREIIRATLSTANPIVAYSGGRDSVVLAEIARMDRPDIPLVYQDTGMADPRLTQWVREHAGPQLVHLPPGADPETTWREKGCLPIGAKVSAQNYRRNNPEVTVDAGKCCHEHKAKPMNAYLKSIKCTAMIVGARGDDSTRHRFKLLSGEVFPSSHGWLLAYPLFCWIQPDIYAFLRQYVPHYPLMYARTEELGCRCCAINLARHPNQMLKIRKADPVLHRRLMERCGYAAQILMIKFGLTKRGAEQLIAREGMDKLIASGQLDRIPYPRNGLI